MVQLYDAAVAGVGNEDSAISDKQASRVEKAIGTAVVVELTYHSDQVPVAVEADDPVVASVQDENTVAADIHVLRVVELACT